MTLVLSVSKVSHEGQNQKGGEAGSACHSQECGAREGFRGNDFLERPLKRFLALVCPELAGSLPEALVLLLVRSLALPWRRGGFLRYCGLHASAI
jgi:hypothetical protein